MNVDGAARACTYEAADVTCCLSHYIMTASGVSTRTPDASREEEESGIFPGVYADDTHGVKSGALGKHLVNMAIFVCDLALL